MSWCSVTSSSTAIGSQAMRRRSYSPRSQAIHESLDRLGSMVTPVLDAPEITVPPSSPLDDVLRRVNRIRTARGVDPLYSLPSACTAWDGGGCVLEFDGGRYPNLVAAPQGGLAPEGHRGRPLNPSF